MRIYSSPNPSPLLFPLRGAWERGRLSLPIALCPLSHAEIVQLKGGVNYGSFAMRSKTSVVRLRLLP